MGEDNTPPRCGSMTSVSAMGPGRLAAIDPDHRLDDPEGPPTRLHHPDRQPNRPPPTSLLELRDPSTRHNGVKKLYIGSAEPVAALERFFTASETRAVVPLPSFHGEERFDCGAILSREAAVGLVRHGPEACASARPVETIEAVHALPVQHN
ncbi:hypothetical protein [Streptomyces sp. NPDC056255]|uniref:hypothetical protein n=1 Tax=Streptomyces sp. NPDC056255 TaxID=3345764 RepID=UPI0035DE2A48